MLSPIAKQLLVQHYQRMFEPLNDCPVAVRTNTVPGYPELSLMRMLSRRPDGQLMQVLATIGASETKLPRREGIPGRRNEYITFLPADWDLEAPEHRWIMDLLADVADFAAEERTDFYYADRLDLRVGTALEHADDDVNMVGCMLLAPLNNEDEDFMTCRTGLFTRVNIIHIMPITAEELESERTGLRERFYPDSGEPCYLCARSR